MFSGVLLLLSFICLSFSPPLHSRQLPTYRNLEYRFSKSLNPMLVTESTSAEQDGRSSARDASQSASGLPVTPQATAAIRIPQSTVDADAPSLLTCLFMGLITSRGPPAV